MDGLTGLFSAPPSTGCSPLREGEGEGRSVKVLRSGRGEDVLKEVRGVIERLTGGSGGGEGGGGGGGGGEAKTRVVLVLDQPDVVLAAMDPSTAADGGGGGMAMGMGEVVASLRNVSAPSFPSSLFGCPTSPPQDCAYGSTS